MGLHRRPIMAVDNPVMRWTSRRKNWLMHEVRSGTLTLYEALSAYGISHEEYQSWERDFAEPRTTNDATAQRLSASNEVLEARGGDKAFDELTFHHSLVRPGTIIEVGA